jgi:hypothetical protein
MAEGVLGLIVSGGETSPLQSSAFRERVPDAVRAQYRCWTSRSATANSGFAGYRRVRADTGQRATHILAPASGQRRRSSEWLVVLGAATSCRSTSVPCSTHCARPAPTCRSHCRSARRAARLRPSSTATAQASSWAASSSAPRRCRACTGCSSIRSSNSHTTTLGGTTSASWYTTSPPGGGRASTGRTSRA